MKKKIYNFLLLWMVVQTSVIGQITFKLKSVVGQQNPSANGLFSYGTFDGGGNFVLFPTYADDNSGSLNGCPSQHGWTFSPGIQEYPFLAYQQLNACEISPQPFPEFGVFAHPGPAKPVVIKLQIPNNTIINYINSNIQRATFGCGENIGYSIKSNTTTLLNRIVLGTSNSPSFFPVGTMGISAGDAIYFVVDNGDDRNNWCDDTALDVEISLQFNPILTPQIMGNLACNTTTATFNVAYQSAGTLELYKLGNPNPIATTTIAQDGNTYNGIANFSGLNLYGGGQFYSIAKNVGQQESAQSELISVTPCCVQPVAPTISVNNATICAGSTATLTASGCTGGTVTWSNGVSGVTTTTTAGTYTATCTVSGTPPCTDATSSASGTVTINSAVSAPVISVNNATICAGSTTTLTASGCTGGTVTWSNGATGVTTTTTAAGTYTATCTVSGTLPCADATSTASGTVTVNAVAVAPNITVNSPTICAGGTATLTAIGCTGGTVTWGNGASGVTMTTTTAGTYTATCTVSGTLPCADATSTASGTVTVNAVAVAPSITVNSPTICVGGTATLMATGCTGGTVTWSNGASGVTMTTSTAGIYTATCTVEAIEPCPNGVVTASGTVTVLTAKAITITAQKNVLVLGERTTLITNCSVPALWSTGETANSIAINPDKTTTYSAICNSATNCGGSGSVTITVNPPTVSIKTNAVCYGDVATISAENCNYDNGITWIITNPQGYITKTGQSIQVPMYEKIDVHLICYTSTGDANASITLEPKVLPTTPTLSVSNSILVGNQSTTLTASGCTNGTVFWSNAAVGNSITVSPSKTTTYSAHCFNGCVSTDASITITVKTPEASVTDSYVCWATDYVLNSGCPGGSSWYQNWLDLTTRKQLSERQHVTIYEPTTFFVSCEGEAGWSEGKFITISPTKTPPPRLGTKTTTLIGEQLIEIGGADCSGTLVWSTGETGNSIMVKPSQTTSYWAYCNATCPSEKSYIHITVKTPEAPVQNTTVCWGSDYVLSSGCPSGSSWYENWLDLDTRHLLKEGDKITIYEDKVLFVNCYATSGWSEGKLITIHPHARVLTPELPNLQTILKGDTTILKAVGCEQTQWQYKTLLEPNFHSLNSSENVISVTPQSSTVYQVRCVNEAGCAGDWVNTTVLVRPKKPAIHVSQDTICVGTNIEIMAQCDGAAFKWISLTDTNATLLISPLQDTTYQVVCIGTDSLVSDTTTAFIKVYQNPKKPILSTSAKDQIIIERESTQITARCEIGSVTWNTGDTTTTIRIAPMKNTIYYATCTNWHCVSDTSQITIRVRPKRPEITDGNHNGYDLADTLCLNKTLNLSVITGCHGTLVWDNGKDKQTGQSITITGIESSVYVVYCVNEDKEVSDSAYVHLTVLDYSINEVYVYPNPTVGKLFIQSKGCVDGVLLRLYTQRGELIYEGTGQEHFLDAVVLDLYHLPSETYILHIVGKDGTIIKKRVVKDNQE